MNIFEIDQEIKLGIPNQSAAKIHAKHKWAVRQDPRVFLYPISPITSLSKKDFFQNMVQFQEV